MHTNSYIKLSFLYVQKIEIIITFKMIILILKIIILKVLIILILILQYITICDDIVYFLSFE